MSFGISDLDAIALQDVKFVHTHGQQPLLRLQMSRPNYFLYLEDLEQDTGFNCACTWQSVSSKFKDEKGCKVVVVEES